MDSLFFFTFLIDYNRDTFHLNAARFQIDKVIFLCGRPTAPSADAPAGPGAPVCRWAAPCSPTSVHNRSPGVDLGKKRDDRAVSGIPQGPQSPLDSTPLARAHPGCSHTASATWHVSGGLLIFILRIFQQRSPPFTLLTLPP